MPPAHLQEALGSALAPLLSAALLRAELPADRALAALVARDLRARELTVVVLKRRLSWVAERRATFGTLPPGAAGGPPAALVDRLLGRAEPRLSTDTGKELLRTGAELRDV